jgi:hypothetical protein
MPRFTFATILKALGYLLAAALVAALCQLIPAPFRP